MKSHFRWLGALALAWLIPLTALADPTQFPAVATSSRGVNKEVVPTAIIGQDGTPAGTSTNPLQFASALDQDIAGTGTLNSATLNATYALTINAKGVAAFKISGLTASGATLTLEGSNDGGTTWSSAIGVNGGTGVLSSTFTADTQFRMNVAGRTNVRLRVSATGTGTITVASNQSRVSGDVSIASPLPPGTNSIGSITQASTNGSTTQTTGGTAQALFGGVTPANGFKVALPSATPSATPCWLSDTTTTPSATDGGSYPVFVQGQYSTDPGEKPAGPVYINCPTTGQIISAKRW